MVDPTPRHGFDRYAEDEDWDYNGDFEALDELVNDRGPVAERPAEGEYPNEMYEAVDERIVYRWDAGAGEWDAFMGNGSAETPFPDGHYESIEADTSRIADNQSVSVDLGTPYLNTAVTDGGTYYGLRKSDDGDLVLDETTDPFTPGSWEEVYRWPGAAPSGVNTGHGIYVTSQGSIITGFRGSIRRSADDGGTFSERHDLPGSLWGISETSDGRLIANNYSSDQSDIAVYESTDDGQSWSVLADESDFAFGRHIHKVDVHPVNDNILAVGGDGGNSLLYRSEDGGETWDEFPGLLAQFVAVCPHPTDGGVWFLGHDGGTGSANPNAPRGIVKVTDNGGGDLTQELVANFNLSDTDAAEGSFGINAVYDSGADDGYLIADNHDPSNSNLFAWSSTSLSGENWGAIGQVSEYGAGVTVQQGPYTTLDADNPAAIVANRAVDLSTADDPLYGRSPTDIPFERLSDYQVLVHDFSGIGDKNQLQVFYEGGGTYMFRQGSNRFLAINPSSGSVETRSMHQFWDGMEIPGSMANDLTSTSPSDGVIRRHDGSGGSPAGLYHGSMDGSEWVGIGETSETPNRVVGQLNEPLGVDVQAAAGENTQINVTAPEGEVWLVDHITANAEISGSTTGDHSIQYHATDNSNGETIVFIITAAHDAFGAYLAPTTIGGSLDFGDSFEAVQRAIQGTLIDDTEGVRVRYTNNTDVAFDSSGDDTFTWTFYGARMEV